jgi:hypothetical protein
MCSSQFAVGQFRQRVAKHVVIAAPRLRDQPVPGYGTARIGVLAPEGTHSRDEQRGNSGRVPSGEHG